MDTSYYKEKYEPIDGKWYIKELLGEGSYGKVFRIEREDMSGTYDAALKVITIPKSDNEVSSIKSSLGMDENSITSYFKNMTMRLVEEFKLMSQLKGNTNIVSYEDHEIIKHDSGIGYDVLIRMELLEPLTKKIDTVSEQDVIKIGIDICRALEVCQKYNIVHRDIKPENIFISPAGDYKLGDFGVAKTMKNEMTVMTTTGTYVYMAPELKKGEKCGTNVDIYSLGMVMYKLLNFNREPFLPLPPEMFTFEQREQALINRMLGVALPKPANASEKLAEIILKACEYNPQLRYENASEMRLALENLGSSTPVSQPRENIPLDETVGIFGAFSAVPETPSSYKLVLNRTTAKDRGGINIYVDGKIVETAVCDSRFALDLQDGNHTIELKPAAFEEEYSSLLQTGETDDADEISSAIKDASVKFEVSQTKTVDYSIGLRCEIKLENTEPVCDAVQETPPAPQFETEVTNNSVLESTVGIFDIAPPPVQMSQAAQASQPVQMPQPAEVQTPSFNEESSHMAFGKPPITSEPENFRVALIRADNKPSKINVIIDDLYFSNNITSAVHSFLLTKGKHTIKITDTKSAETVVAVSSDALLGYHQNNNNVIDVEVLDFENIDPNRVKNAWAIPRKCPNCSETVKWGKITTQRKKFSVGKAAAGALLVAATGGTAAIGLALGAFGNKKDIYYCGKCGFNKEYKAAKEKK